MCAKHDGFDEHGNPLSRAFDLGGGDEERLRGEKILLYVGYAAPGYEWYHAQQAVAERGIQMDIDLTRGNGRCHLDERMLSAYTQLWFVSSNHPSLSRNQLQMISDFVRKGNGLLIWADNEPYYADANLLAQSLIGASFSGDKQGDKIMVPGTQVRPGFFIDHPLTQGVNRLFEGITICTIAPAHDLTLLAQSHDGQMCMACFERGDQRIVLDTGFTKLSQGAFQKTAGTARYFRNIAFWLSRASRGRQYTLLTPGRDGIAHIDPSGISERYRCAVASPVVLTYLLQWEGNAELGLVVQDPSGGVVREVSGTRSPVKLEVPADRPGDWVCWVKGTRAPHVQFPYVLTLVQSALIPSAPQLAIPSKAKPSGAWRSNPKAYTKTWSSTHPGCLIILLDQSGSMNESFGGKQIGAGRRKCDMVATILNSLLNELVTTNTAGQTVKPRAEIAVLGYEGNSVRNILAGSLSTKPFAGLPDLLAHPLRVETRMRKEVDDNGQVIELPVYFPVWVEPRTGTTTPMCAALRQAHDLATGWAASHPDSYPPVVINITDGAATDGDPTESAAELCQVETREGGVLLFNCHITNLAAPVVEFPASEASVPDDPEHLARLLFNLSSEIPEPARQSIRSATERDLPPRARGMIFNGDASAIRQMFVFATVPATRAMADPNR
jgi:hypothetical protein